MRSRTFCGPLALLVLGAVAGCTVSSTPPAEPAPAAPSGALAFQPSNVPASAIDFTGAGDLVITGETCGIDTDSGAIGCVTGGQAIYKQLAQGSAPGAVPLGIFLVKSLRVEAGVKVSVRGSRAFVVIAEQDIDLRGELYANATSVDAVAGGASGTDVDAVGKGAGGGGAGSTTTSAAGGSMCGAGGAGAAVQGAAAAQPGARYGNDSLVPLVAGSSGGQGTVGQAGGGGGAVELVALGTLTIAKSGLVHVGGGGGAPGGLPEGQNASGGGSGGAILLEGAMVSLTGTLAANGGGGGQGALFAYGSDASPDEAVARGADKDGKGTSIGGNGGAASSPDGSPGKVSPGMTAGAGGGGVGRIRINSVSPLALPGAVLSPTSVTRCMTTGTPTL